MSGTKELLDKISSIKDTLKITSAMYLISSNKLRKAKRSFDKTRRFFDTFNSEFERIAAAIPVHDSIWFGSHDGKRNVCVAVTADKGLAGSYNHNVLKEAERLASCDDKLIFISIGEYGSRYFKAHGIPYLEDMTYPASEPTMHTARKIAHQLYEGYNSGEFGSISVLYTDYISSARSEVKHTVLAPAQKAQVEPTDADKASLNADVEYFPSPEALFENLIPTYLTGYIFSALSVSYCGEQEARMTAMNSANKNAEEMLDALSVRYKKLRQDAITFEITEITAGTKSRNITNSEAK